MERRYQHAGKRALKHFLRDEGTKLTFISFEMNFEGERLEVNDKRKRESERGCRQQNRTISFYDRLETFIRAPTSEFVKIGFIFMHERQLSSRFPSSLSSLMI